MFEGTALEVTFFKSKPVTPEAKKAEITFEGFNAEQEAYVRNALGATGLPLGNVRRVIYQDLPDGALAIASYRSKGEMVFYPSFFAQENTVHGKRSLMSVVIHEVAHAADPILSNGRNGEHLVSEEQMSARAELIGVIDTINFQSAVTGKYLDGATGYHKRLHEAFFNLMSLSRLGKATAADVREAWVVLQIELYAVVTQLSLMSHGQLKKLEEEQKEFWDDPRNASQVTDESTNEKLEFRSFVHDIDRLVAVVMGFGSINALKAQRQKISEFIETSVVPTFAPPPPKIEQK